MKPRLLAGLALAAMLATPALAEYPERPVTFIEPWPPGDVDDQILRVIAEHFGDLTGVPAQVVNRAGGFGVEGAQSVASARPDGYTIGNLLIDIPTSYIVQGFAPYQRDSFEVVGLFMNFPFILAAPADAPYSNLAELATYAQDHEVRFAHFGFETLPAQQTFAAARSLGFEFSTETGYDITDCSTLSNGDADVMNTTIALVLACLDDVKILAAYTAEPLSVAPDAPLLSEQVDGPAFPLWSGLFVPAGTPQEVKDRIAEAVLAAIASDQVAQIAAATGTEIYWQPGAEAQARIDADFEQIEALFAPDAQ
ncbi:tripartite tricarboxylate transporter substrate binding protein [Pararhodobacter marinus]|uniref:tripartite tricarboxylate transporter substrate binding protein n=1 Tax=Pararhodobacter marinus TaxID=2184063 RepID=UPI0035133DA5